MADQLVLAIFKDEAAADNAVDILKKGAARSSGIEMGPVGVLVLDEKGQIKEHKLGKRSGGKGAGIGLVLAAVAPPTLLVGMVGGAAIGHFRQKGLGLSAEDRDRITAELSGGKAALGVVVLEDQVYVMEDVLNSLGGTVETHPVSAEVLEEAAAQADGETEPAAAES